jgi:hypothetical protein
MGFVTAGGCSEWRGVLALRAIGRSSDSDVEGLNDHLEHCDQCRADAEEVDGAAAALALLDDAQVDRLGGERLRIEPPADLEHEPAAVAEPVTRLATAPKRRRWVTVGVVAAAVVAIVSLVSLTGSPSPTTRTVALTGEPGVTASVALSSQTWGTRATLRESGQAGGQVLTVSMRTYSGRWWVAGSYRTTGRPGTLQVQLSCAAKSDQITDVWVSDQGGHTVLNGYVS